MKRLAILLLFLLSPSLPAQQCRDGSCWGGGQAPGRAPSIQLQRSQGQNFSPTQAQGAVPAWIVAASVKVQCCGVAGSGTVVALVPPYGVVLTNSHVVSGGRPDGPPCQGAIEITFPSGKTASGRLRGRDVPADLAAVLILADQDTPYVPVSQTSPARGMAVWGVGYPLGKGPVQHFGQVEGYNVAKGTSVNRAFFPGYSVISGDSGGGVFTQSDGRLCGVVSARDPARGNACCAVEWEDVSRFVAQVLADVNILSPNRGRANPNNAPQQAQPFPAPPSPPAPSVDPSLAGQVAAHEQRIAALEGKVGQNAGGISGLEARLLAVKDVADRLSPLVQNLPAIEARIKAVEANPEVQKIPALANGLDKAVGLLEKAQPVLNTVDSLRQQVQGNTQAVQQQQQQTQQVQQTTQQHGSKLQALEAAVSAGGTAAHLLGGFGLPGLLAAGGVGLGAGALAWRKSGQQPSQPQAVAIAPGAPDLASLLAAVGGQVQANMVRMGAQGIMQGLSGNPGSMGRQS